MDARQKNTHNLNWWHREFPTPANDIKSAGQPLIQTTNSQKKKTMVKKS